MQSSNKQRIMPGKVLTWKQKQHYRTGEMMVHLSANGNDIYPGNDIHESCGNPPEYVWRITAARFNAIICVWISDLCLCCSLQLERSDTQRECYNAVLHFF